METTTVATANAPDFANELEQPAWFQRAITMPHTSGFVPVDGCDIHYLHWPAAKKKSLADRNRLPPSVVFVHGTSAHAHWFHHIAPFFADEAFDAISISLSGFGDSGWREVYGQGVWSKEVLAVCEALGLFRPDRKAAPILVGHSLGSFVVEEAALISESDAAGRHPIAGVVVLDGGIPHPVHWILEGVKENGKGKGSRVSPFRQKSTDARQYPVGTKPYSRLRLTPFQETPHPYVLEHIANHSVKRFDDKHWTWKFDPAYTHKYDFGEFSDQVGTPENILSLRRTRVAVVYGEKSKIVTEKDATYMRNQLGDHVSFVSLVEAGHHCLLDQPLQVVTCLRSIFAEWSRSGTAVGDGSLLPRLGARSVESDTSITAERMREGAMEWWQKFASKEDAIKKDRSKL